ncbi:hypothetical protein KQI63_02900 [bacterium]|nr:hypothetical protein [bacterium]
MGLFRRTRPLVVIVCTANITRSPYFAGRLRQELLDAGIPKRNIPEITSAGVSATDGVAAHPVMQTVAHLHGFSLGAHQAKRFDEQLVQEAVLILTMEQAHADRIRFEYPEHAEKVFTLLEFGREGEWEGPWDVEDPTGGEVEDFQQYANLADAQAQRIRRYIRKHGSLI